MGEAHVLEERLVRRVHARGNRRQAARPHDLRRARWSSSAAPSGEVAALEDFCPHRGAPLSLGSVREGRLVCGYHGLEMGCDGSCVAMPGQRVRGFPPIRAYPAVERYGFVWVWPGDAAAGRPRQAAPSARGPRARTGPTAAACIHIACDYRLMIDNLMDLTHETYVHATSIGQKEIDETPTETRDRGRRRRSPAATWRASWRRRSGAWRCAATTSPTTCRSTAGRSAASPRPATC